MSDPERQGGPDNEAQWGTIAIYEQILAANSDDTDVLSELFRACLAVGETARAQGYGERLGALALDSGDPDRMRAMQALLSPHAEAITGLQAVIGDLAAGKRVQKAPPPPAATRQAPPPARRTPPAPAATGESTDIIALVASILEHMPDDRKSLEVLAAAYPRPDDGPQTTNSLFRLAEVLIRAQDRAAAAGMLAELEALRQVAPEAVQAASRLEQFLNVAPAAAAPVAQTAPPVGSVPLSLAIDATRRRAVLADEMDLLWDLKQQGLVTEALYAGVVRDLTELTSSDSITTISALHGLSFRGFAGLDALLVQIGARASVPVIALVGFDLQPGVFGALPLDYLTFQGVIPFERLGGEILVAVLNPVSARLRNELSAALGCPCHYFLIPPADFDIALEVVKNRYQAA
ncbi:MAG: hypothetical protein FJ222_09440 [Lentisphaerae bacterium]|nr:hypothetical protein [Lentisphaerota bacterium]